MRRVIVESPFAANTTAELKRNIRYARAAMHDCLKRGDAPFASHLLYTQPGVLDDNIPEERECGIEAGLSWGEEADATVVYVDFGITPGMQRGIDRAAAQMRVVEKRTLPNFIQTLEPRPHSCPKCGHRAGSWCLVCS